MVLKNNQAMWTVKANELYFSQDNRPATGLLMEQVRMNCLNAVKVNCRLKRNLCG